MESFLKDFLLENIKKKIESSFIFEGWVKVYYSDVSGDGFIEGAAVDISKVDKALKSDNLLNFPDDEGFEPLIHPRGFTGCRDRYLELSEEFRLDYNLYEDYKSPRKKDYLYINRNGDEEIVAKIEENKALIRLDFLKDYISARNKHFLVYFRFDKYSEKTIQELGMDEICAVLSGSGSNNRTILKLEDEIVEKYIKSGKCFYSHSIRNIHRVKSHSWLKGRTLIKKNDNYKSNDDLSPYERMDEYRDKYVDFILGYDDGGKKKLFTCNERKLSNSFGENPDAPPYITPVFFRRDVLKKYYNEPSKYDVMSTQIECKRAWSLKLDNDRKDYVIVLLGHLGMLHYKEQLYWKSFNIPPPDNRSLSRIGRSSFIKGEFYDHPDSTDHYLKQRLEQFNENWFKKYEWDLFKPLPENDSHCLKSLHLMTSKDNRKEFNEQILALAKIFIESLNEKELIKGLYGETPKGNSSINKLEMFLRNKGHKFPDMIKFLRNLYALRSSIVHRSNPKRSDTKKTLLYFGFDKRGLDRILEDIFIDLIRTMNTIERSLVLNTAQIQREDDLK